MPSPFPGMDPYIEASGMWADFHARMLVAMSADLNSRLPKGYGTSIELYVWLHEPDARKRRRRIEPDVYVVEKAGRSKSAGSLTTTTVPAMIVLPAVERRKQRYVQIVDRRSRRVVTIIELLSPANKNPSEDREAYLVKRNDCLAHRVNLVEIDLLRGGPRLPLSESPPLLHDYYVMVCRPHEFPKAGLWSFSVRDPLPEVPIPLDPGVSDVPLPLRPCIDRAYDEGRYVEEVDYHEPLAPRLSKRDGAWARAVLKKQESTKNGS